MFLHYNDCTRFESTGSDIFEPVISYCICRRQSRPIRVFDRVAYIYCPCQTHDAVPGSNHGSIPSVNFQQKCVSSDSSVFNFLSFHGIFYGRSFSPIGRNTLFCCKRYNVTLFDFIHIDKTILVEDKKTTSVQLVPCSKWSRGYV